MDGAVAVLAGDHIYRPLAGAEIKNKGLNQERFEFLSAALGMERSSSSCSASHSSISISSAEGGQGSLYSDGRRSSMSSWRMMVMMIGALVGVRQTSQKV